jgi:hypothetical protein
LYKQWIDAAGDDADQLQELRDECDEQAKLIETEFQMKRDAELARALQADEDYSQLPIEGFNEQDAWDLPDRTHPVKLEPLSSKAIRTPQTYAPITPFNKLTPFSSDDDIQEITADSFNSRSGKQPVRQSNSLNYQNMTSPYSSSSYSSQALNRSQLAYPSQLIGSSQMPYPSTLPYPSQLIGSSQMSYPPQPYPSQMPYSQMPYPSQLSSPSKMSSAATSRVLPWAREPSYAPMPGAYDKFDKAFDLVRNQSEIFDDDADIV